MRLAGRQGIVEIDARRRRARGGPSGGAGERGDSEGPHADAAPLEKLPAGQEIILEAGRVMHGGGTWGNDATVKERRRSQEKSGPDARGKAPIYMRAETALARLHANVKTPLTLALTVLAALPSPVPATAADADGFVPLFNAAISAAGARTR